MLNEMKHLIDTRTSFRGSFDTPPAAAAQDERVAARENTAPALMLNGVKHLIGMRTSF